MRVRGRKKLEEFWRRHPDAKSRLARWLTVVTEWSHWTSFRDVRNTFRSADTVTLADGRNVVVFDIGGNNYRLIADVQYREQFVVVLTILTHAEYDKEKWK